MPVDAQGFLGELATFLATAASLNYSNTAARRAIFRNQANDDDATDPASVLRIYDDKVSFHGVDDLAIQCMTRGIGNDAVQTRAQLLFGKLFDTQARVLHRKDLTTYRIIGLKDVRGPSQVARDEKDRVQWVFNFIATVATLPA